MPLAAMTIAGVVEATTATDSCADATMVMREVPNTATSRSVGFMPGSSSFTRSE